MRRLGLYPLEWVTLGFAVAVVAFLAVLRLSVSLASVRYTAAVSVGVLPQAAVAGFVLGAIHHFWKHREIRSFCRHWCRPAWWGLWLRLWLATLIVSFAYFWLKVYVPLINPGSWDQVLWRLDKAVHLGFSPNEVLIRWITNPAIMDRLDWWYAKWLNTVLLFISFMTASIDAELRRRFVLSCLLLWAIGALGYVLFPAVGPIYVNQELWAPLGESLPRAARQQENLWNNYQLVFQLKSFDFRYGVAALPSLHVGFHVLFCLWAWRYVRLLFVPFVIMTLLTQVGSVLTGWHYAVDGYCGALLAWGCYRLALFLECESKVQSHAVPRSD